MTHQYPKVGTLKLADGDLDPFASIGRGWWPTMFDLDEALARTDPDAEYVQVKEKFGGLRVYTSALSDEGHAAIRDAEERSYKTCETCGRDGVLRKGGWVLTLCDEHADGREPYGDED